MTRGWFGAAGQLIGRPSFPLGLLLLALSTVFLFGGDRDRFYRPGHHDWVSSEHLAVAANLSAEHGLLMFHRQIPHPNGAPYYAPYNRFPVGGYALLKLAALPFSDDLSATIHAARILMLAFFAAAALLAYCALTRLLESESKRWIALAATLLTFASPYCLYYNDMIHPKTAMDLFGVMLVFHGMVVFVQRGRVAGLLAKSGAALLLGWHVLALLLTFIILGVVSALVRARTRNRDTAIRFSLRSLLGRYLTLGSAALLVAVSILTFNLANEWRAMGGEHSLTELPSVQSAMRRTGITPTPKAPSDDFGWRRFLEQQFFRIGGGIALPFSVADRVDGLTAMAPVRHSESRGAMTGYVLTGVCFASLIGLGLTGRLRLVLPLASLSAFGFVWSLPMRNNTQHHDFEALFYLGIPLVLSCLVLAGVRRLAGGRALAAVAVAALLAFVSSACEMGRVGTDGEAAEFQKGVISDFETIRKITSGRNVTTAARYLPPAEMIRFAGSRHAVHFYLAGNPVAYYAVLDGADFLITRDPDGPVPTLTPDNRFLFLYDAGDLARAFRSAYRQIGAREPAARSRFDVHLRSEAGARTLSYVREPCDAHGGIESHGNLESHGDLESAFFLDIERVLTDGVRIEHDSFDFFEEFGLVSSGRCLVTVALPDFEIARITTGQRGGDGSWDVSFDLSPPPPRFRP